MKHEFPLASQKRDAELNAEINHHLEEAIHDRIARGETPDEARANALRGFGEVGWVRSGSRTTTERKDKTL